MLRKLVLVGVMVVYERGSVTQLVAGTVICAVYLFVQMHCAPYSDLGDE